MARASSVGELRRSSFFHGRNGPLWGGHGLGGLLFSTGVISRPSLSEERNPEWDCRNPINVFGIQGGLFICPTSFAMSSYSDEQARATHPCDSIPRHAWTRSAAGNVGIEIANLMNNQMIRTGKASGAFRSRQVNWNGIAHGYAVIFAGYVFRSVGPD